MRRPTSSRISSLLASRASTSTTRHAARFSSTGLSVRAATAPVTAEPSNRLLPTTFAALASVAAAAAASGA